MPAMVLIQDGQKVKIIDQEEFASIAYHLGRRDQRREDRERLDRSAIPKHWVKQVVAVLDGE